MSKFLNAACALDFIDHTDRLCVQDFTIKFWSLSPIRVYMLNDHAEKPDYFSENF